MPKLLTRIFRWTVAGGVVLLAGAAAWFWFTRDPSINGVVVSVSGNDVVIQAESEPRVGEPVTVYFDIPGFDDMGTAGSGTVTAVQGARANATIIQRHETLAVGQFAKIGIVPSGPVMKPKDLPTLSAAQTATGGDAPPPPPPPSDGQPLPGEMDRAERPNPLPPLPQQGAAGAIGCFKDTSDFDLDGHLERSAQNTPQRCIALCKEMGFAYAGLQYGESCLCGNSYGRYGAALSEQCNYPCTGDALQTCGGNSTNAVYATAGANPDSFQNSEAGQHELPPPPRGDRPWADSDVPHDMGTPKHLQPGRQPVQEGERDFPPEVADDEHILENGVDRPGMDLISFDQKSADPLECLVACQDYAGCIAFTHVRPGFQGERARCWLKSGVPPAVASACCISGRP